MDHTGEIPGKADSTGLSLRDAARFAVGLLAFFVIGSCVLGAAFALIHRIQPFYERTFTRAWPNEALGVFVEGWWGYLRVMAAFLVLLCVVLAFGLAPLLLCWPIMRAADRRLERERHRFLDGRDRLDDAQFLASLPEPPPKLAPLLLALRKAVAEMCAIPADSIGPGDRNWQLRKISGGIDRRRILLALQKLGYDLGAVDQRLTNRFPVFVDDRITRLKAATELRFGDWATRFAQELATHLKTSMFDDLA